MKQLDRQRTSRTTVVLLGLCLMIAPALMAQVQTQSDMSSSLEGPTTAAPGDAPLITVSYANDGPDNAPSAYVDAYVPFGLPMTWDEFTQEAFDELQNSAATFDDDGNVLSTTDTNGNVPLLFVEDNYCEHFKFQLQGAVADQATPIQTLGAGEGGSFTFNPQFPMEDLKIGTVEILEPADLAATLLPATTLDHIFNATQTHRYTRGGRTLADPGGDGCEDLGLLMGPRVSNIEAFEANVELVDDGSDFPARGCGELQGFTPGNIALIQRGDCQFGLKAFNAEAAGASGVIIMNADLDGDGPVCSDDTNPRSSDCMVNMGADDNALGLLVSGPVIGFSENQGLAIINALDNGQTVRMRMGQQSALAFFDSEVFLSETQNNDPNDDNNSDTLLVAFGSAEPPVAAFSFSPANPTTGSAVMFTDESTGTIDTWAWDFGDGGTSTEQSPSHTFSSAGTFTVSLTVTNGAGSNTATQDITVALGADLTESYFIPAAALAAGLEGAFFQTDVDINNGSAVDATYAFLWLPRGQDNSNPTQSDTFTLAAGASIRYENVLAEVFDAEPDVAGALAVISNTLELNIMSRTYDVSQADTVGTFGQALPGIPAADLIGQNDTRRIIFMSENDDLRANLGCVNGVNDAVPIDVTTYDAAGNELETQRLLLPAWSNNQINQIFADFAPTNGYADVTSIKANAGFYCYGSVLDNNSNDPTTVLPVEYGADAQFQSYFVPAAALSAGLEGAFFQTDVDINNAGDTMATYQFLWLPRGQDNSEPTTSESFTLAAGASVRYENVLAEVFDAEPDVAGALAITSDSASLGVMSRTYDVSQADTLGTFGQAIPGIPADLLIGQNDTRRIIFMSENDALRANLGCVNGVNDAVPIDITTYDAAGNQLETQRLLLPAWSNNQINQIFADFAPTNGYADVTSIKANAGFYCYGSVLDNNSNDPTTILPQ